MKTYLRINRRKQVNNPSEPCIEILKEGEKETEEFGTHMSVRIHGPSEIVHGPGRSPFKGAAVWIETESDVEVIDAESG